MPEYNDDIARKLLVVYHEALTAAVDAPDSFLNIVVRKVRDTLPCDGLVMVMEPDRADDPSAERAEAVAHIHIPRDSDPGEPPEIEVEPMRTEEGKDILEELITRGERDLRQIISAQFPGHIALHTYWFRSGSHPRIAVCLFRKQMPEDSAGDFTGQERELFSACEKHIILILRIHADLTRSRRQSFDFFADICREIANASGLTSSEYRVLRQMVQGASNNDICQELRISLATVKTHISHILQKTGCRNRADLIGKYFSSKKAIAR